MQARAQLLAALHTEMRACQRCLDAGYPIVPGAVFSGPVTAQVMIVGQAPGITESQAGRPFNGPSGQRLFRWLADMGWPDEAQFRATEYITAVTKCYPGKSPNGRGDRLPTRAEQALCTPFLRREIELVSPRLILAVGRVATTYLLGKIPLNQAVGCAWEQEGRWIVPLPHPSGASGWLNHPAHRDLLAQAIAEVRRLREELGI